MLWLDLFSHDAYKILGGMGFRGQILCLLWDLLKNFILSITCVDLGFISFSCGTATRAVHRGQVGESMATTQRSSSQLKATTRVGIITTMSSLQLSSMKGPSLLCTSVSEMGECPIPIIARLHPLHVG